MSQDPNSEFVDAVVTALCDLIAERLATAEDHAISRTEDIPLTRIEI